MNPIEKVFVCKYKIVGIPIAFLTEEEAKQWVSYEPEIRYYEEVKTGQMDG